MGELRIRNAPKELIEKFKQVEQHFKTVESTKAIEQLIRQFFKDQETIKSQRQELSKLMGIINTYVAKEGRVIDLIHSTINNQRHAINYGKNFISAGELLIKQLVKARTKKSGTNKKKKTGRSGDRKMAKKFVPKKKGGSK
jgi:hypothetical protein